MKLSAEAIFQYEFDSVIIKFLSLSIVYSTISNGIRLSDSVGFEKMEHVDEDHLY